MIRKALPTLDITYGVDKSRTRSSGYVIPMSVMADMLSANNLNNRNS
ncbi:MAG: hypothetical protein J6M15_11595 [Prevotella sp.]|nr:hypothetical protein [Prevotella sp.]MBP3827269.1 hypothetical protein [Prevotella sp.]